MGDSTTAGTPGFRSPVESPPHGSGDERSQYAYWLMQAHPDWRVLNHGVNGERADQVRHRLARILRQLGRRAAGANRAAGRSHLDVVVLIAGVNDIYQGRSAPQVIRELEAMYTAAAAAAAPVVAGSILPYNTATAAQNSRMHDVNDWVASRAHEHRAGVVFCDTRRAVSAPDNADMLAASPDELHPSAEGYRLLALALEPAIRHALALNADYLR